MAATTQWPSGGPTHLLRRACKGCWGAAANNVATARIEKWLHLAVDAATARCRLCTSPYRLVGLLFARMHSSAHTTTAGGTTHALPTPQPALPGAHSSRLTAVAISDTSCFPALLTKIVAECVTGACHSMLHYQALVGCLMAAASNI